MRSWLKFKPMRFNARVKEADVYIVADVGYEGWMYDRGKALLASYGPGCYTQLACEIRGKRPVVTASTLDYQRVAWQIVQDLLRCV